MKTSQDFTNLPCLEEGYYLYTNCKYEEAINTFNRLILSDIFCNLDPFLRASIYYYRAMCKSYLEYIAGAYHDFDLAISLYYYPIFIEQKARFAFCSGDFKLSLLAYNQLLKDSPQNPDYLLGRAYVYAGLGFYRFSFLDLDSVVSLSGMTFVIMVDRLLMHREMGSSLSTMIKDFQISFKLLLLSSPKLSRIFGKR